MGMRIYSPHKSWFYNTESSVIFSSIYPLAGVNKTWLGGATGRQFGRNSGSPRLVYLTASGGWVRADDGGRHKAWLASQLSPLLHSPGPEEWLVSITGSMRPQPRGHWPPFPQSSPLQRLCDGNHREPCRVRLRSTLEAAKLGSEDLD